SAAARHTRAIYAARAILTRRGDALALVAAIAHARLRAVTVRVTQTARTLAHTPALHTTPSHDPLAKALMTRPLADTLRRLGRALRGEPRGAKRRRQLRGRRQEGARARITALVMGLIQRHQDHHDTHEQPQPQHMVRALNLGRTRIDLRRG